MAETKVMETMEKAAEEVVVEVASEEARSCVINSLMEKGVKFFTSDEAVGLTVVVLTSGIVIHIVNKKTGFIKKSVNKLSEDFKKLFGKKKAEEVVEEPKSEKSEEIEE